MNNGQSVIAIFDVGKTNKKFFLFDQHYNIVFEQSARFNEITDEDGEPCENIEAVKLFLFDSLREVLANKKFNAKVINFSAYGASFVYLDKNGNVLTPLYNYLKKYPPALHRQFYETYGGEEAIAHQTASPVLGSLNSGLQLYRIKYEKPDVYANMYHALHLPQFLSYLVTHKMVSDMTSIGSHTALWDFSKNEYHDWVKKEGIEYKLAPVLPSSDTIPVSYTGHDLKAGIGLHDSSAALIPYLVNFREPFVLIATGTWNIAFNPFNQSPLTTIELEQDCLCYLSYRGVPVKASRLFAGHEHDEEVKSLASRFDKSLYFYEQVQYDPSFADKYDSYETAYHHFMFRLLQKQLHACNLVMTPEVKLIFVDGGFSKNPLFMNMLASLYPAKEVYAATIAQSTALGAALAIHHEWNRQPLSSDLIQLKLYRFQ